MLLQIVSVAIGLFCAVNSYVVSPTGSESFSGSMGDSGGSMSDYGGGMRGTGGYRGKAGSYGYGGEMSQPKPYNFNYQANGMDANSFRTEQGDSSGNVQGSYGYTDAQGLYRQVQYTAGADGFRASVKTNEPGTDSKPESPADVRMIAEPAPAGIQEKYTRRAESFTYEGNVGELRQHGGRGSGDLGGEIGVYGGIGEGMGGHGGIGGVVGGSFSLPAGISLSGLGKTGSADQSGNVGEMRGYGAMGGLRSGMGSYGGIGEGMSDGHGIADGGSSSLSAGISLTGSEKTGSRDQGGIVGELRGLGISKLVEYSGLGGGIRGSGMDQHGNMGVVGDGSSSLFTGMSRSGSEKIGARGYEGNAYGIREHGGTGIDEYGGLEDGIRGNSGIGLGMGRHGDKGGISGDSSSLFAEISRSESGKSIL